LIYSKYETTLSAQNYCLEINIFHFYISKGAVINVINDTTLTDNELCSVFIGCDPVTNPILVWNITLPNVPKPPIVPPIPPQPGSPTLRILQLTDIHVDFDYQPGALAECSQPLCCRNSSKLSNANISDDKKAGYWGDYRNCDVPIWTVENMFDHISRNEQVNLLLVKLIERFLN